MSSGPNLECGHGQCDVRRDCITCLQFTVQTLNDRHYKQGIELSNCEADLRDAREALDWIAAQEDLTFAECSLAEEIISRAKNWKDEDDGAI